MARLNVWVTADGSTIRVRDLADRHLLNILGHVKRRAEAQRDEARSGLSSASGFVGGEDGSDMIDSALRHLDAEPAEWAAFHDDRYWTLLCLAAKRGLVARDEVDLGRAVRNADI